MPRPTSAFTDRPPGARSARRRVGRRFVRALGALVAVLVLAGCATSPTPRPAPAALATRLPAAWQAPLPPAEPTALADWWTRFQDPALPALVAAAQQASPTLAVAAARIERARATRTAARAALLPQLDAAASVSHGKAQLGQPTATTGSLGVQAGWEIDLFGAGGAARRAADARFDGALAGWHDARVSLAAETATSVVALRACEAQLVQARIDAESRDATARLTDETARAGFTAPADAALARAGAAQSRSQALAQAAACETLLKSLVELTDWPEPELRQRLAVGTAVLPAPAPIAVQLLPAQLLERRPDLTEAARNVVAAAADADAARARELPRVALSGSLAGVSVRSAGFDDSGTTWSIGPLSVSLPLFDGGARAAQTAAARAGYDEAVAVFRAQLRRAVREVEAALVALQATAEREADVRAAAADFEAALRATAARQRAGLASLLDLENARRNAAQAQSTLIELQRERVAAWIALYRALGGGFDEAALPDTPGAATAAAAVVSGSVASDAPPAARTGVSTTPAAARSIGAPTAR
jgi:NodT family efflux transporter outer membrane factor (OMF) lipoprotein